MHRMLVDLPESFGTARLTIRGYRPGDGPLLLEAVRRNRRLLEETAPAYLLEMDSVEQAELLVRQSCAEWLLRERMAAPYFVTDSGEFAGELYLQLLDADAAIYEVGYWGDGGQLGKGYATEAVLGALDLIFGRLGAEKALICCDADNVRSCRVAERSGFQFEGRLRNQRRNNAGQLIDRLYFGMLREEWEGR